MLTVFLLGEDRLLLETRRPVLESIGLKVMTAGSAIETLRSIPQLWFDVAILCHSLPADRRRRLATELRRANPAAPVLLVGRGSADQVQDGDADIDAVLDPDPKRLTETLRGLLHLKQPLRGIWAGEPA